MIAAAGATRTDGDGPTVVAVLDAAAGAAPALEAGAALAAAVGRALEVVYVERTSVLVAASVPITRVLSHAGAPWTALSETDVERGFRADVARVRALAAGIAPRHAVGWTLRAVRGEVPAVVAALSVAADLLLVAPAAAPAVPPARRRRRRPPVVAVATDADPAHARVAGIAAALAHALAGELATDRAGGFARPATLELADVLVRPRGTLEPRAIDALRCSLLLVG